MYYSITFGITLQVSVSEQNFFNLKHKTWIRHFVKTHTHLQCCLWQWEWSWHLDLTSAVGRTAGRPLLRYKGASSPRHQQQTYTATQQLSRVQEGLPLSSCIPKQPETWKKMSWKNIKTQEINFSIHHLRIKSVLKSVPPSDKIKKFHNKIPSFSSTMCQCAWINLCLWSCNYHKCEEWAFPRWLWQEKVRSLSIQLASK